MIATLLLEITLFNGEEWKDCDYNAWKDCDYNTWMETDVIVRASQMGFAGADGYWDQNILSMSPLQFRISNLNGGHVQFAFGDATLALDTFNQAGVWPPPEAADVLVIYADENRYKHELFSGALYRKNLSRDGIVYQFYGTYSDKMLLDEGEAYTDEEIAGDDVPLPRAFGAVKYMRAVRLPDTESGNQVYHHGYMAGTLGTDWNVYDDGVEINENIRNITSSVFEIDVLTWPVGEVTVSGSGVQSTIAEVMAWAGTRMGLSVSTTLASEFVVSHWADSQQVLTDFMSSIAAYACHMFYVAAGVIYLIDMAADNYAEIELTENDFLPSAAVYPDPVSMVKSTWVTRDYVEETVGNYVKDTEQEASINGSFPFGSEQNIEPYQTKVADVKAALSAICGYLTSPRWETSIPMDTTFPVPGQKIIAIDESMGNPLSIAIRARDIEYDFEDRIITISGDGTIS
jgi:hypothetical protein